MRFKNVDRSTPEYVCGDDAANNEAMTSGIAKSTAGLYGAASWWPYTFGYIAAQVRGSENLETLELKPDPFNYVSSLGPVFGPEFLDSTLGQIADVNFDLVTLASTVGVSLSDIQYASLSGVPYLESQSVSLGNHHLYGSSRLGIAQYQPAQFRYIWDYKFGLVDTFGLTKSRSWQTMCNKDLIFSANHSHA